VNKLYFVTLSWEHTQKTNEAAVGPKAVADATNPEFLPKNYK